MNYSRLFNGSSGSDTPAHPLTHHEIIRLVRPFTHRDRHVDLEASDRIARKLVFKPMIHEGAAPGDVPAREILQLDNPKPGLHRLTRRLTLDSGLSAMLEAEGCDPAELLERIEQVPPSQQFQPVDGAVVARSYRLRRNDASSGTATDTTLTELTRGEADIAGFNVVLNAAQVKGYPAEIEIMPKRAEASLPEDLLAVIGWAWSPLRRKKGGWIGKLKVRGHEPELSRRIETKLEATVAHLARTLTKPPAAFHRSLLKARWGVTFRRALPLLFFGGLIAGAASLTLVDIPQDSILNLMLMGAPPLLMFGAFSMRDTPSLEIPPFPRQLQPAAWEPQPIARPVAAARAPLTVANEET
jgi:hypothetical protein